MVKRKPPIVLGTVLVLGLGVAYYFNSASKAPDAATPPPPPSPTDQVTSKPREGESKAVLADKMKKSMQDTHGAPHMPGGAGMVSDAPTAAQQQKPKPNDSSTSAQWYK